MALAFFFSVFGMGISLKSIQSKPIIMSNHKNQNGSERRMREKTYAHSLISLTHSHTHSSIRAMWYRHFNNNIFFSLSSHSMFPILRLVVVLHILKSRRKPPNEFREIWNPEQKTISSVNVFSFWNRIATRFANESQPTTATYSSISISARRSVDVFAKQRRDTSRDTQWDSYIKYGLTIKCVYESAYGRRQQKDNRVGIALKRRERKM